MRQKRAKQLRRFVYGDMSTKGTKYTIDTKTGQIKATGLRRHFMDIKKGYRNDAVMMRRALKI